MKGLIANDKDIYICSNETELVFKSTTRAGYKEEICLNCPYKVR